jgi:hypothetical protein
VSSFSETVADRLAHGTGGREQKMRTHLRNMPPELRAEVEAACNNPGITHSAIAAGMNAEGYDISESAVRNYRAKEQA